MSKIKETSKLSIAEYSQHRPPTTRFTNSPSFEEYMSALGDEAKIIYNQNRQIAEIFQDAYEFARNSNGDVKALQLLETKIMSSIEQLEQMIKKWSESSEDERKNFGFNPASGEFDLLSPKECDEGIKFHSERLELVKRIRKIIPNS